MSKQKNQVNDLLAAISRTQTSIIAKEPSATKLKAKPEHESKKAIPTTTVDPMPSRLQEKPKGRVGSPVQFWMHDADRRIVRELSAWLAGQGIRPTDSMIIRAALRMAKTGGGLIEAYHEASKVDSRRKATPNL